MYCIALFNRFESCKLRSRYAPPCATAPPASSASLPGLTYQYKAICCGESDPRSFRYFPHLKCYRNQPSKSENLNSISPSPACRADAFPGGPVLDKNVAGHVFPSPADRWGHVQGRMHCPYPTVQLSHLHPHPTLHGPMWIPQHHAINMRSFTPLKLMPPCRRDSVICTFKVIFLAPCNFGFRSLNPSWYLLPFLIGFGCINPFDGSG